MSKITPGYKSGTVGEVVRNHLGVMRNQWFPSLWTP